MRRCGRRKRHRLGFALVRFKSTGFAEESHARTGIAGGGTDDNSTEIDPYFTLDLQLSKQVLENLILSLDIQDIFDNKHMISNEAISPGRIITGGIAVKF